MKARMFLAAALAAASLGPATAAPPQNGTLSGEVLEARSVEGYTYLRLKTATGETWAAVPTATVKAGERVTLADPMVMENFESKSLKRKFDRIVFATVAGNEAPHAAANPAPAAAPKAAAAPAPVAKVAKASEPDAKTVGEVSAGKAALKDRSVTVRGQVVKVNSGILGKNWLHLQDGTGKAADGSDDLIVTTTDAAAVGDVVTVSGTVRTDVNVGSGYAYAVLVENAKVRK